MVNERLKKLCDIATEAHQQIQADYAEINPVVGVNQRMREQGFATDIMTIDCLRTGKQIVLILNDQQHDVINYQFCYKEQGLQQELKQFQFEQLTAKTLYDWIAFYFSD